ncbi:MAG: hypothetical protein R3E21_14525 [Caenibius sp.]
MLLTRLQKLLVQLLTLLATLLLLLVKLQTLLLRHLLLNNRISDFLIEGRGALALRPFFMGQR